MGSIFKSRFSQAKGNLEVKIKNLTGTGMALKRKRKTKKFQVQGKRWEVNYIFTEE